MVGGFPALPGQPRVSLYFREKTALKSPERASLCYTRYAVNELPQPQLRVACGF